MAISKAKQGLLKKSANPKTLAKQIAVHGSEKVRMLKKPQTTFRKISSEKAAVSGERYNGGGSSSKEAKASQNRNEKPHKA